ncbi:MAG: hybrid sensor histidine kinase/response regulator [Candidatus Omnitrophica bacterium]|nr:hybrid sensor histidine kinase/response regulator [Candidatus Omnitrophota bacterium]
MKILRRKIYSAIGLTVVIPLLVVLYLWLSPFSALPSSRQVILGITLWIVALGVLILVHLMNGLARIDQSLCRIAKGDVTHRASLDQKGTADLAHSINEVSQKLTQEMDELHRRAIIIGRSRHVSDRHSEYLAGVVHELRSPIINIEKSIKLLRQDSLVWSQGTSGEFLRIIEGNTRRLFRLVNDLLDISRMESGALPMKYERVLIGRLVSEAKASVSGWMQSKKMNFQVQCTPGFDEFDADKYRIEQVLVNLLSNAVKYSPAGGTIVVSVSPCREGAREYVSFSVSDTGKGISDEDQKIIFQRYKTGNNAAGSAVHSTGLGLPIAQRIVQMHGGRMWVDSCLQRGSTFTFILPRYQKKKTAASGGGKRILVMDDESAIRELLARELRKLGYQVVAAGDGIEGLQHASQYYYDLVIADVRMPNIDGITSYRALRRMMPKAGFIFMTGFDVDPGLREIVGSGNHACVTKPLDLPQFLQTVEASLKNT